MYWLKSMLSDGTDHEISSKRAITLLAFILCSTAFIADLFWDLSVAENVYEGMMYIAIAGLGFTASERFIKKPKDPENDNYVRRR
jgi:hypothetical protein